MRQRIFAGFFVASILFSACANSELLSVDLDSPGDQHLTVDTTTGLEWLDLSQTQSYSINDVLSDRGGWWSRGFRYATYDQVNHLYNEAGLVQADDFAGPATPALAFQSLVGMSWISPTGDVLAAAWFAPADPNSANYNYTLYPGGAVVVRPAQNDYYAVVLWAATSDLNLANDAHASWLVRPAIVPIPAAAWMLASALGALGWARRRSQ